LCRQFRFSSSTKPVATPGVRSTNLLSQPLSAEDAVIFKSATMRLSYLAQDRPDIGFAAKELARHVSLPTADALIALKRCIRYLIGRPRLVWRFTLQSGVTQMKVFSDSDHAGCPRTRKSTSCSVVFFGSHCVKFQSTTQTLVSLSSGESEFYALVKSCSLALGMKSLAEDLGWTVFC
jgi:hypothetical protein